MQRSFAGGELAPALYARTDQVKYATGLRTCRNFLIQRHGGVANRPGTEYVAAVKDSTQPVRLIRFHFNDEQTYVLEFGDGYVRVLHDGGHVVVSGVAAWVSGTAYTQGDLVADGGVTYYCRADHTAAADTEPGTGANGGTKWWALTGDIFEIPGPYAVADLAALKTVQSADVVTIVHPSYPPHQLKRFAQTRWTLAPITFGPTIASPANLSTSGGTADASSTVAYAVTAVKAGTFEESLPTIVSAGAFTPDAANPIALTWDAVPGATEYNIYRADDGRTFGFVGTSGGTPQQATDTAWDTASDSLTATGPGNSVSAGQARNTVDIATHGKAADERYTVAASVQLTSGAGRFDTSGNGSGGVEVYYSRDGEPRLSAGAFDVVRDTGTDTRELTITVPDNGYSALVIDLVPQLSIADDSTWTFAVTGTGVTWAGGETGFSDPDITPDFSLAPPVQQSMFDQPDAYPSAVGYYQQRQLFANTNDEPERVWGSKTGNFPNFSTSTPLQDDDAVQFIIAGNEVNAVRHLMDLGLDDSETGSLLLFTQAAVHLVQGDVNGTLTPTAVNPRRIARHGVRDALAPIAVDNTALYVQARGSIVRDLRSDPDSGRRGTDLSVFAAHLFTGYTLVDWDYAETPNSIVWAARSDGTLLGLTYIADEAIWGWHRHDTDGVVENVCVVPEGDEDRVYLVVKRTVNGATVRYIERMASRFYTDLRDAVFLDAALSYDGRNTGATTMTLSGGSAWDESEQLTCTASANIFSADDLGNGVYFTANDGSEVRCLIEAYTSPSVVTVRAERSVPAELRDAATAVWSRAADTFAGLEHLEGKTVAVFADGYVAASPNNSAYPAPVVTNGAITLDRPYAVVHVGLPFVSDLETLDMDTPQGPSLKDKEQLVNAVGIWVEESRGIWAGGAFPTGADPLDGLDEYKARSDEDYDEPTQPITDAINMPIQNEWNSNGRVVIRQVDPLPLTVLAVIPRGYLPTGG